MRLPHTLVAVLLLAGCTDRPQVAATIPAATPTAAAAVVSTSTAQGVTLIEGTAPTTWEPGTVLRIYDAGAPARMKGLAVVQRGAPGQFTARLTGLSDRLRPLATGDRVVAGDPFPVPPPTTSDPSAPLRTSLAVRDAETQRTDQALAALHARLTATPEKTSINGTVLGEELARIEAERAYFDLCVRVLKLDSTDPAVTTIKGQVRTTLAARAELDAGGTHPTVPKKDAHGH
jgi:hypothetical protein